MVKRQFKSLQEVENYLKSSEMVKSTLMNQNVKNILSKAMSKAVWDVVYKRYLPTEYKRRGNEGGLSDVRNMNFTKVDIKGNTIKILFENLTLGQTHQIVYELERDTADGQYITDIIVERQSPIWHRQGQWSESRDFVSATVASIKANPSALIGAIKDAYRKAGFTVK